LVTEPGPDLIDVRHRQQSHGFVDQVKRHCIMLFEFRQLIAGNDAAGIFPDECEVDHAYHTAVNGVGQHRHVFGFEPVAGELDRKNVKRTHAWRP
jgi:hypothetical protein